jgi:CRISPR-associated protein Csx14
MSAEPRSTLCLRVDAANPGQYLACCGLLELANRIREGAVGWFEEGAFHLDPGGELVELLEMLTANNATELTRLDGGLEVKPLIAPLQVDLGDGGRAIMLDAWMKVRIEKGIAITMANPPWNFWSGQQTSLRIWTALRAALKEQMKGFPPGDLRDLFDRRIPLSGRFGFDPGAAWNALDVGFSPNEQKIAVASSPAVELLAAVGLQRFRPAMLDRMTFRYMTWGRPLPVSVAGAAACGAIDIPPSSRFLGHVVNRGSYAALGYSSLTKGENSDE